MGVRNSKQGTGSRELGAANWERELGTEKWQQGIRRELGAANGN